MIDMMKNSKHALIVAFVVFVSALIAGCVQQAPQGEQKSEQLPGIKQFSMVIGHTFYNPSTLTVNKGDTVVIKAVASLGTASHLHGITIDEFNINQAVTTEDANNPVVVQFVADKEGTFIIYCKTCWSGPFGTGHPPIKAFLEVKP